MPTGGRVPAQGLVKLSHQILQAMIATELLAEDPPDASRYLRHHRLPLAGRVHDALNRPGKSSLFPHCYRHPHHVGADDPAGAMDYQHILRRHRFPRKIDVPGTPLALHKHSPILEQRATIPGWWAERKTASLIGPKNACSK